MALFRSLQIAALIFFASSAPPTSAQSVSPVPDVDLAAAGLVYAAVRQPDGGMIVGGYFVSLGGVARANIARLRVDGTVDPDWAPTLPSTVQALAVDAAGSIYAGGTFGVVKISAAGVVDASWQGSTDGGVEQIALDGNGHVYVASSWLTQAGGRPAAGIARLDAATGAADPGWALSAPVDRRIYALAADADGLYVGGDFDAIGGQPRRNLAKLSTTGSVDPAWTPAPDRDVYTLAVDGASLYVGGYFNTIGGQPFAALARVARTGAGSADASWHPVVLGYASKVALDGAGSIYATGTLTTSNISLSLARFSLASGAIDADWAPEPNGRTYALAVDATRVVVGGQFDAVSASSRFGVAAIGVDGTLLPPTNAERAAHVWAVAPHPDGGAIIGGSFHRAGAFERRNLARITAGGTVDPVWNASTNAQVVALSVDDTGAVYVGGSFQSIAGQQRDYVAKLSSDGVPDPHWNPSPNFVVRAIARDGNGSVYLGGAFLSVGGLSRARIAKVRPDGSVDPTWDPGADGEVYALELDGNGSLYAGGAFSHVGSFARSHLAKLSTTGIGMIDATWNPAVDGSVQALATDDAGMLYVGGYFSSVGTAPRRSLARIAANGTPDSWDPLRADAQPMSNNIIRTLVLDDGDGVYVGGTMHLSPINPYVLVARIVASAGTVDDRWRMEADSEVSALAIGAGRTLIAGGGFTRIGGVLRDGFAVLTESDAIFANGFEAVR